MWRNHFQRINLGRFFEPYLSNAVRVLLGLLFITSSIFKITSPLNFSEAIIKMEVIPLFMVNYVTVIIPSVELICGIGLFFRIFQKGARYILFFLIILFTAVKIILLAKGLSVQCNCFGPLTFFSEVTPGSIGFNIFLLGGLLYLFIVDTAIGDFYDDMKMMFTGVLFISVLVNIPMQNNYLVYSLYKNSIIDIRFDRAESLIKQNSGVYIDSRDKIKYDESHIQGAISIPFQQIDESIKNVDKLTRDTPLFVYCDNAI